jgi:GT2 family glycosyltransferase
MSNKKISIIIVNYNSETFLKKCLASIYAKLENRNDFEIIIVNNDQKEKLEFVTENYPHIKIMNQDKNLGFGAGNNAGTKIAEGEIFLFLNPDTEIISENISAVLSLFEKNQKLGAVGAKIITPEGFVQKWSAGFEATLLSLIGNNLNIIRSKKIWESKVPQKTEWVSGTAIFIRKKLFFHLNGFDEKFFMYFEDMDFCKRARKEGYQILFYPNFIIKHESGKSYEQKKQQKKDYHLSQEKYFKKHHGKIKFFIFKILKKFHKNTS